MRCLAASTLVTCSSRGLLEVGMIGLGGLVTIHTTKVLQNIHTNPLTLLANDAPIGCEHVSLRSQPAVDYLPRSGPHAPVLSEFDDLRKIAAGGQLIGQVILKSRRQRLYHVDAHVDGQRIGRAQKDKHALTVPALPRHQSPCQGCFRCLAKIQGKVYLGAVPG